MAGTPVGTIYAEIDLDDSKYTAGQQRLLKSVQSVSLDIESNFKTLGDHCASTYDLMRQKIENSYLAIVNSAKSSNDDIVRAEQLKNQQLQKLNDEQFGAQTSALSTLKENWVAASAAIIAAWALVNEAVSLMDVGAHAQQVQSAFDAVSQTIGVDSAQMLASMTEFTQGTVTQSDLASKATKMMLKGYDPQDIIDFSSVAVTASIYMGSSVSDAFDKMSDAIATRMPRAMVQAGAVTREQMSIVTAAIKAGADQSELMGLAIDNLTAMQAKLSGTDMEAALTMQQFHTAVAETKEMVGSMLFEAITPLIPILKDLATLIVGTVVVALEAFAIAVKGIWAVCQYAAAGVDAMSGSMDDMAVAADASSQKVVTAYKGVGKASEEARIQQEFDNAEVLATTNASIADRMKKLQAMVDAKKHAAQDEKNMLAEAMNTEKAFYEAVTAWDKDWFAQQKDNNTNSFNLAVDYYNMRNDDIQTSYEAEWDLIDKSKLRESEKYKMWAALDLTWTKQTDDNQKTYQANMIAANNANITNMAAAYKVLGEFSDESMEAAVANIDRQYAREAASARVGTDDLVVIEAAHQKAILDLHSNREKATLDMYAKLGIYESDYEDLIESLAIDEYNKVIDRYGTEEQAEKAYSDYKIAQEKVRIDSTNREGDARLAMYRQTGIYADNAEAYINADTKGIYDYTLLMTGNEEVAYKAAAKYHADQMVIMAGHSDDFWDGVTAKYTQDNLNQQTWGQQGEKIFTDFYTDMASSSGTLLFDVIKGKSDSFLDVWHSFVDDLLKTFTTAVGQMITQWALFGNTTSSFNIGGLVSGATGSTGGLVGLATSGYNAITGGGEPNSITPFTGADLANQQAAEGGSSALSTISNLSSMKTLAEAGSKIYSWFAPSAATAGQGALSSEALTALINEGEAALAASTTAEAGAGTAVAEAGATAAEGISASFASVAPFMPMIAGVIGATIGYFDRSFAGSGSHALDVVAAGQVGGYPDFGQWSTLDGASGPASPKVLTAFMQDIDNSIMASYQSVAGYLNTLSPSAKIAAVNALVSANIQYLPTMEGLAAPWSGGFGFNVTREQEPNLQSYVESIPGFILSQISPILGAKLAVPSAVTTGISVDEINALYPNYTSQFSEGFAGGLDYVPYDMIAKVHKGEGVVTAAANLNSGNGSPMTIQNHLYIDGKEIKLIADKVIVDRNKRNMTSSHRGIYS